MSRIKRGVIITLVIIVLVSLFWSVSGAIGFKHYSFTLGYRYNSDTNSIEKSMISFYGKVDSTTNKWGVKTICYYPKSGQEERIIPLEGSCTYVPQTGNHRIVCLTTDGEIPVYVESGNNVKKVKFFDYIAEKECISPSDPIHQNRYWFDDNLFVYEYEIQKLLKSGKIKTASVGDF